MGKGRNTIMISGILIATILITSIFAFSVVGSVDAKLPTEELKAITLTIERVEIVHTTDLAVKGVVLTVLDLDPVISINFLALQGGVFAALDDLGISDPPDGFVTQIRIVTTDASITFNGETFFLSIPSGVVKLNGVLIVSDEDADAVFEFDAEKSLISNKGQGCCKLKPVLKFEST